MRSRLTDEQVRLLEERAYQIRRLAIEMVTYAQWGHIGGPLSMAELMAVLYFHHMQVDPSDPKWEQRDRFILSKAHGSPALYAALALRGFFPVDAIYTYCELRGLLEAHTDMRRTPGVESSGGSLGLGLSIAVGVALGLTMKQEPRPRVYCLLGDGETNEGSIWEAAMSAAHYRLDNLIALLDYNKVMAKGFVKDLMAIEPVADKWRAFGWEVCEIDGHDVEAIANALYEARWIRPHGAPVMIIAHTVKGRGVRMAEFDYRWHTQAPRPPVADQMLRELAQAYGMPEEGYSRLHEPIKKEVFYGGE